MKKAKVERKNVPEFTPPEPNSIERVHKEGHINYIYEYELENLTDLHFGFFGHSFKDYIWEINFPKDSKLQKIGECSFAIKINDSNKLISHIYSITFPPSLQIIDLNSFGGCQYLNQITFQKDNNGDNFLEIICKHAFSDTKIESIVLPENIKKIDSYVFPKSLKSIEFENGAPRLTKINNFAFANTQIEKISMPLNIDSYIDSQNVFLNCKQLKSITFDQDLNKDEEPEDNEADDSDEISDSAKSYLLSQTKIENLEVFVSNINKFYFYNTPNLTSINIPNSDYSKYVKMKGLVYTKDMKKLIVAERNIKSATISSKCQVITNFALNVPSIEKVTFENNSELKEISNFAFSESQVKKITLPNTVERLLSGSFYKCIKLESINVPHSIKTLEYATFSFTNLTSMTIPKSVKKIGYGCFYKCSKLAKISFEEGSNLTEIDGLAFAETNIASILIPKSVTTIGDFCFINCSKLKSVKFEENSKLKTIGKECFRGTIATDFQLPSTVESCHFSDTKAKVINFIGGNGSLQKVSQFQSLQITEFCIPSSATKISKFAFLDCVNLSVVKVADMSNSKLEKIKKRAFLGCQNLKEFDIPKTVSFIGSESFKDCVQYKGKINLSSFCIDIGESAFENSGVISFESESELIEISDSAFKDCKQLKKIVIQAKDHSKCSLGSSAFSDCTSLSTIKFNPKCQLTLGFDCFNNTSIKEFESSSLLKYIPDGCFRNCKKLVRATFDSSSSLTSFGKEAFYETAIKSIFIPSKVDEIGESCFENCKGLKEVTFSEQFDRNQTIVFNEKSFCETSIEKLQFPNCNLSFKYGCFRNCSNLKNISFDSESTIIDIGENAFESTNIVDVNIPYIYRYNERFGIVSKCAFKNCKQLKKILFQNDKVLIKKSAFEGCNNLNDIIFPEFLEVETEDISLAFFKQIEQKSIDAFFINEQPSISHFACFDFGNLFLLNEKYQFDIFLYHKFDFYYDYEIFNSYFCVRSQKNENKEIPTLNYRTVQQKNGGYYINYGKNLFLSDFSIEELNISKDTEIIDNEALKYSFNLKKIEFENGSILNTIGSKSFECLQIEEITIPDTVKIICDSAFRDCRQLKKVVINEASQLATIGSAAFEKTAIETILFPSNLKTIDSYAFYECFKLKTIENRSKEIEFGENCFYRSAIENIDFPPNSVFGYSSFKGCLNLKKLTFLDKPQKLTFEEESFAFSGLEDLSLDCEVEIHQNAFIYCLSMKQVALKGKMINIDRDSLTNSNIESCILNTKSSQTFSIVDDVFLTPIEKVSLVLKCPNQDDTEKTITEKHFMNHKCYVIDYALIYANLIDNVSLYEKSPPGKKVQLKKNEVLRVPSNVKKLNFPPMPHIKKIQWASNCIVEDLGPIGAFSYYNLTEITIPKLVQSIPDRIFEHCHFLEQVSFEEDSKLEEVGNYSFASTNIEKIDLPETVKIIGHFAFYDCSKLKEVSFHGKSIGTSAFEQSGLLTFDLSNNVEIVADSAFRHCHFLTKININVDNSNLSEIGNYAFADTSIEEINIPPEVKVLLDYTFDGCEKLKEINFSKKSKLSKIEKFSFTGLISLSKISVPQKLMKKFKKKISHFLHNKYFVNGSFEALNDRLLTFEDSEISPDLVNEDHIEKVCFVTSIKDDQNEQLEYNPNCFVENNCYVVSGELKYVHLINNSLIYEKPTEQTKGKIKESDILRVPSEVTKLTFSPVTHIKRILWSSNCKVEDLGGEYFFTFYNLQEITIPKLVKSIPAHCFENCHYLRVVQFQKGSKLKEIGDYSFSNTRIEKIEIPKTVQTIGHFSFFNDQQLKEVICDAKTIGEFAFAQTGLTTFSLPNKTKSIRYGAFQYCRSLTTFEIDIENSNLSIIRPYAFNESSITEINIPQKVKAIREFTFSGCQFLKEVNIAKNSRLSIIEDNSFSACLSLTTINIPKSISQLGSKAFVNTPSLQMIMNKPNQIFRVMKNYTVYGKDGSLVFVPRNLIKYRVMKNTFTIRSGAFCGPSIEKVSFSDNSLVKIEDCAFAHSTALKKVHLPNSLRILGEESFIDCQSLERLEFEPVTKLKEIPKFCFAFSGLRSIKLPIGIEVIKSSSFYMCQNLRNINLADTNIQYIGDCAFSDTNLSEIKIPSSVKFIGSNAFAGNKNVKLIDLTKLDIIVDTNQLPIISFVKKLKLSNDKLLNAFNEFVTNEFNRKMAIEQAEKEQKERNEQNEQKESKNDVDDAVVVEPENRENSPLNKKVPTISMNMLSSKKNPVIFKPNINSSRPTSSKIQSPRKNQASLPILPPQEPQEENQTKSPRKINRSPSNNNQEQEQNQNQNQDENENEQVNPSSSVPVEETIVFNYNEEKEDEDEDDNNDNKVCFIHEFAFSSSQIKLFTLELDEYKWFSFFDYCSRIEQYQINKNITLSLHKLMKEKPKVGNLTGLFFKVKKIDYQDPEETIPMFIGPFYRRRMRTLNPFNFLNFTKLSSITFDDNVNFSEIPKSIFAYSGLKEITIPSSVNVINESAFYSCRGLNKVTFSKESHLTEIKKFAFFDCRKLNSISIPSTVKIIPKKCFTNSGLKSIKLPKSTEIVDYMAFGSCHKLQKVTLNKGLKELGEFSFANNSLIESIDLPDSLEKIKSYSFSNCVNLKQVKTNETTKLIEIHRGSFENTKIEELSINKNATILFEATRVPKLNKITFCKGKPKNFVQLNDGTIFMKIDEQKENEDEYFYGYRYQDGEIVEYINESLHQQRWDRKYYSIAKKYLKTKINVKENESPELLRLIFAPKNLQVLKIEKNCFSISNGILDDMTNLTSIEYMEGDTNYLPNYGKINKINDIKILGENVILEPFVFSNFNSLEKVDFSEKVELLYFPKNAFFGCENLHKITIPSSCLTIDEEAFKNCTKLEEVEIGYKGSERKLKYIKKEAFMNCTSLRTITIPSSVTVIFESVFMNCSSLEKVKFNEDHDGIYGIKVIKKNAFKNCTALSSINLPSSCIQVGPCCFMNCTSLKSFSFEGKFLRSIECRTFYNCTSLSKVEIRYPQNENENEENNEEEDEVTDELFKSVYDRYDKDEKSVFHYIDHRFNHHPFSILQESFMNCSALEEVIIEDKYKNAKIELFDSNKKKIYRIPNAVINLPQFVGKRAFANCSSLKKASFFIFNLQYFDEYCFENCSSLTEIATNTKFYDLLMSQNLRRNTFIGTNNVLEVKLFNEGKVTEIKTKVDNKEKPYSEKKHFKQHLSKLNKSLISDEILKRDEIRMIPKYNCLFYSVEKRDQNEQDEEKEKGQDNNNNNIDEKVQDNSNQNDQEVQNNNNVDEKQSSVPPPTSTSSDEQKKTEYKIDKIKRKRHFKEYLSSLDKSFLVWTVPGQTSIQNIKKKNTKKNFHHQKLDPYGVFIDIPFVTPGPGNYDIVTSYLYDLPRISLKSRHSHFDSLPDTPGYYDIPELKPPLNI